VLATAVVALRICKYCSERPSVICRTCIPFVVPNERHAIGMNCNTYSFTAVRLWNETVQTMFSFSFTEKVISLIEGFILQHFNDVPDLLRARQTWH